MQSRLAQKSRPLMIIWHAEHKMLDRIAHEVFSKDEAKNRGLKRYFTGLPCKRGHVSQRFVSTHNCCQCREEWEQTEQWRQANLRRSATHYKRKRATPDGIEKLRAYSRKYKNKHYAENKERFRLERMTPKAQLERRRRKLKRAYGLTIEQHDAMLLEQEGRCAICCIEITLETLATDHDHSSKQVRGLLCIKCNAALGLLGDSSHTIEKAAEYLRRFGR